MLKLFNTRKLYLCFGVFILIVMHQGCEKKNSPTPADESFANNNETLSVEVAQATQKSAVPVPESWQGQGILAKRMHSLPHGAPPWLAIQAQVIEKDGHKYLQTTGRAARIKNNALARTTAENRARAEIARWIVSKQVNQATVTQHWQDKKNNTMYAQCELVVPGDWIPGRSLE